MAAKAQDGVHSRFLSVAFALVVLAALVCGVWECAFAGGGVSVAGVSNPSGTLMSRVLEALAYTAEASLVEEVVFRGVVFLGLYELLKHRHETNGAAPPARIPASAADSLDLAVDSRALIVSALVSSLLFGLCHLLPASADAASGVLSAGFSTGASGVAVLVTQAVLKVLQASLFGCVVCAFVVRSRNFEKPWPWKACALVVPLLVHFVYDLLSFGPLFIAGISLPDTYVTGDAADAVPLVVSTVLLAAALAACYYAFHEQKRSASHTRA